MMRLTWQDAGEQLMAVLLFLDTKAWSCHLRQNWMAWRYMLGDVGARGQHASGSFLDEGGGLVQGELAAMRDAKETPERNGE